MQTISFQYKGSHKLVVPDGEIYRQCAVDIIEGRCYPLPEEDDGPPIRSVVDLGAHAGEFTILAATRWPQAIVHAYEPNPEILSFLEQNCKPYPNIVIHRQAVNLQSGREMLYFNSQGSVAASLVKPNRPAPEGSCWAGALVDIVGPDSVLAHQPDVLKIDIEGPEAFVLAAMEAGLKDIERIYVEYHHETVRIYLEQLLIPTHSLRYAHVQQDHQGEVMYLRKNAG